MTKAMLNEYVLEQKYKRTNPLDAKIMELQEKEKKQAYADLHLDTLEAEFKEHLNAAYAVYEQVLKTPGVMDSGYYYNPKYRIDEMLKCSLSSNITVKFDYSEDIRLLVAHRDCIAKEYDKVVRVMSGLPNGKACAKYLKQLGFELPGEEKIDKALSVEINIDILGLRKADA